MSINNKKIKTNPLTFSFLIPKEKQMTQDPLVGKILLIDDNIEGQILVKKILAHFSLDVAGTVREARDHLNSNHYDLILLDVNLPDGDGFSFLNDPTTRSIVGATTIFYLTARNQSEEKVTGFNLGADDYITKPFDVDEFKARIEAHMRKKKLKNSHAGQIHIGNIYLDLGTQTAQISESADRRVSIDLTTLEFRILLFLTKNQNRAIRREEIIEQIWSKSTNVIERTLDSHISNLRKKLKISSMTIQSIYGIGYRFIPKINISSGTTNKKAS